MNPVRLDLEPGDFAGAPVAEVVVAIDPVALDEVVDPVAIGVARDGQPVAAPANGEIELAAGLGLEIGVAGDETAAGDAAVVAVGQQRIAEAAGDLERRLDTGAEVARQGEESGEIGRSTSRCRRSSRPG